MRVRGIHYRNQPIKVLAKYEYGLMRVVGFDQDKDVPLEVVKIPKVFPDVEKLGMILNTFDAYKELIFSKYFLKYRGFDTLTDPDFNLYFLELVGEPSLADLYQQTPYKLKSDMLLFKYWAKEAFHGLSDLLGMCTYSFQKPLKLVNMTPSDQGTKLTFGKMVFEDRRCKKSEAQEELEALLLQNLGLIILEMLCYSSLQEMKAHESPEQVELVTFVETLLGAPGELQRYMSGNTLYHMTFENVQSHPFFSQPDVLKADVLDLAEEFARVFQPKEPVSQPYTRNLDIRGGIIGTPH